MLGRQLGQDLTQTIKVEIVYFKGKAGEHILCRREGEGLPVLLVHPVGLNARYFDGVTSTLVQHHCRVVRFDLP